LWEVRSDEGAIARNNLLALVSIAHRENRPIFVDHGQILLEELRGWAKEAAAARWEPDRDRKIVLRSTLRAWWERRTTEILTGAATLSGDKLREKLAAAGGTEELISMAVELRRVYADSVRTPRYMAEADKQRLQALVKSELMSLRSSYAARQIDMSGLEFHSLCLQRLDELNRDRPSGTEDRGAFMKGCMYDIADRCLHRFSRPE
jgi:hypothetical protein